MRGKVKMIDTLLVAAGIPAAITGFGVWWVKRRIEANERKTIEQQQNIEALIMMMVQSSKANHIGITAIAKAVQRIPEAQCNGDMTAALIKMEEIQQEEKQFLMNKGIKYIFE